MKLYYSPGACSLSPHIVLREAGIPFEMERVDLAAKKTEGGKDYLAINPKGYVPALQLDDGQVLTEGAAIVQFLADLKPDAKLAPKAGTVERARVNADLTFVSSELHKSFAPLFSKTIGQTERAAIVEKIEKRLGDVERQLGDGRAHMAGAEFSVADAYLFTVANWASFTGIDLGKYPKLSAYMQRVRERDHVQAALAAEGIG